MAKQQTKEKNSKQKDILKLEEMNSLELSKKALELKVSVMKTRSLMYRGRIKDLKTAKKQKQELARTLTWLGKKKLEESKSVVK